MSKLGVGAGVMLAVVLAAKPAQAKCFSIRSVAIRGDDSRPGLHLTREQWGLVHHEGSPAAVVIEGMFGRFPKDPDPPRRLGPRYRLIHVLDVSARGGTQAAVMEQDLYPNSSNGPVTFTPPQTWHSCTGRWEQVSPGWQPFPAELVENVRSLGLPPPAGALVEEDDRSGTAWGWPLIVAAVVVGGPAGVVVARRRRGPRGGRQPARAT